MTASPLRVLHVVDRATGGVPVAVAAYIGNSPPGFEHHVLAPFGVDGSPPEALHGVRAALIPLGEGHVRRIRRIATTTRHLRPATVHAHSSFAGGYARLALRSGRQRITYTPHCYAFERRDIPRAARWTYRCVEWMLGWNTGILAACSATEAALSEQMTSLKGKTRILPNLASVPVTPGSAWDGVAPLRVAMIGRVSPQKDPLYFETIVAALRECANISPVWIGDGDDASVTRLRTAGVEVTGWLAPAVVSRKLSEAHVYIHSAAWEGFPISVLDAHALDRPILARAISAFAGLDPVATTDDGLTGLRDALSSAASFASWVDHNRRAWDSYLSRNTRVVQREMLASIWGRPEPSRMEKTSE